MTSGSRPKLALTLPAIAGALMALAAPAQAQNEAAPAGNGLERAQKAADAVFHWIKLNADKAASRQSPPPPPPPAARKPAPVAAAPRPAPAPAPSAASAPAPVQAAAAPTPTPAPAPAPVVAAAEPEAERGGPVLLAAAAPTPAPAAPLPAAARAVEPPPAPAEEEAETPLKLLVKVDPAIPRQLQQQTFRNGFAQVQFTVAPDGTVAQARAIKASHNRLGMAAVDAIKQWRFAPIAKARDAAVEIAFNNAEE